MTLHVNKMGKFKWVPMLIKAYVDAQTQLQRTRTGDSPHTAIQPETAATPLSAGSGAGNGREAVRPPSPIHPSMGQPVPSGRQRPQTRVHPERPNYQLLYRELRETKERLDHLEGIRQQLDDMQHKLDHQLAELSRRLESNSPERQRER